jgi:hypothetical protein
MPSWQALEGSWLAVSKSMATTTGLRPRERI